MSRPASLHPAIVRAVDPVARTASLHLAGGPAAWQEGVPLAAHVDGRGVQPGDGALVVLGPEPARPAPVVVAIRPAVLPRGLQPLGDLVALAPAAAGSWYGPVASLPDDAGGLALRGIVPADLAGNSLAVRLQVIALAAGTVALRTRLACFPDGTVAAAWNIDGGTVRTVAIPAAGTVADVAWTVSSTALLPGRPLGLLVERQADANPGVVHAGPGWLDYPRA